MLELVSTKHLLTKPRYPAGMYPYHHTGLHWSREDCVALAALCEKGADLEKSALGLGRKPTTVAWRASDTGLKLPREWRDTISTYKRKPRESRELLQYPFIRDVRGEHEQLLAVNALVPRGLPDHMRADVCQEIMLALWTGDASLEELQAEPKLVRKFVSGMKRANFEQSGYALSLDVPLRDGRSWYDILPEQDAA